VNGNCRHPSKYAEASGLMYARIPPKATIDKGWRLPIAHIAQANTAPFSPPLLFATLPLSHTLTKLISLLQFTSLVHAYQSHSGCPPAPNPRLHPRAPSITALLGIFVDTYLIVVDLWLAGRTNPFRSVGRSTCWLPLRFCTLCHVSEWPSP
jgi:hypothetical protein